MTGCVVHASTWILRSATHANVASTPSMAVRIHQHTDATGQRCWQGTGIAMLWTVGFTTTPVDPIATGVVHWKMTMELTWWLLEVMALMLVLPLDGKLVTGFALGKLHSHWILFSEKIKLHHILACIVSPHIFCYDFKLIYIRTFIL